MQDNKSCTVVTIGHSPALQHRRYIIIETQVYPHTHTQGKPAKRQIACHNTGICLKPLIDKIGELKPLIYKIGLRILWSVFCHSHFSRILELRLHLNYKKKKTNETRPQARNKQS